MELITNLKIGHINNLSDARYGAGVGASFLGFCFELESPEYLNPEKAKEILGWVKGPAIVGEFDIQGAGEINDLAQMLELDYVQMLFPRDEDFYEELKLPVIQNFSLVEISSEKKSQNLLSRLQGKADFFILSLENVDAGKYLSNEENKSLVKKLCGEYATILNFNFSEENIVSIIEEFKPYAINFNGESELRPGYREFGDLPDLVELLER